jgi:excisionase family DNA binding protein
MALADGTPVVIPRLLYSPAKTEKLLGISHATLYRLIRARRLDAIKIGAATRITSESIERLVANLLAVGRSA